MFYTINSQQKMKKVTACFSKLKCGNNAKASDFKDLPLHPPPRPLPHFR